MNGHTHSRLNAILNNLPNRVRYHLSDPRPQRLRDLVFDCFSNVHLRLLDGRVLRLAMRPHFDLQPLNLITIHVQLSLDLHPQKTPTSSAALSTVFERGGSVRLIRDNSNDPLNMVERRLARCQELVYRRVCIWL